MVTLHGITDLLFKRWHEPVGPCHYAERPSASEELESNVFRNAEGVIVVPGRYIESALWDGARYQQHPEHSRTHARAFFQAHVICETESAPLNGGVTTWDFVDTRTAWIGTRTRTFKRQRPAFRKGWTATFTFVVLTPLITTEMFRQVVEAAGRFIGIGDFRPSYGLFRAEVRKVRVRRGSAGRAVARLGKA